MVLARPWYKLGASLLYLKIWQRSRWRGSLQGLLRFSVSTGHMGLSRVAGFAVLMPCLGPATWDFRWILVLRLHGPLGTLVKCEGVWDGTLPLADSPVIVQSSFMSYSGPMMWDEWDGTTGQLPHYPVARQFSVVPRTKGGVYSINNYN